jgi:predicted acetyltransferase
MTKPFEFICPDKLVDDELELVLTGKYPADPVTKYSPYYEFEMRLPRMKTRIGVVRLRIDRDEKLRYCGHIGYEVYEKFRGHRYAARSCRLLFPLALAHGLSAVWLTVDPKNSASRRTCEILGAEYVETLRVPKDHEMYVLGARYRRRYRLDLKRAGH